jgi:tripartite-type tricarboxylate transporter receptor subunit TctC
VLKDVPSVVEQGFPNLVVEDWVGFAVRNGTPDKIVTRLNEALNRVLAREKVREALARIGAEAVGGSPAEFGTFSKAEITRWAKVVKDSGIKIRQK